MIPLIIVSSVIILILIIYFNRFVSYKNKVKSAWSDIDVQLKRRYDLIPNIVKTVHAYAGHEKKVLEEVIKMRSKGMDADTTPSQEKAENMISGALNRLFAVVENYPDIKADKNFLELQNSLIEIEDHIQLARRYYNALVRDNNTAVESFPGNLLSKLFGFSSFDFFEIESSQKANINIDINKN